MCTCVHACVCVQVQEALGDLGGGHLEAVLACLKARGEEIRQALVERTNAVSSAQLQDFDWQIKVPIRTPVSHLLAGLSQRHRWSNAHTCPSVGWRPGPEDYVSDVIQLSLRAHLNANFIYSV